MEKKKILVALLSVLAISGFTLAFSTFAVANSNSCPYSPGDWQYCSACGPCDVGEGDCDNDSECKEGLACESNVGANYGWSKFVDVCEGEVIAAITTPLICEPCEEGYVLQVSPNGFWCQIQCPDAGSETINNPINDACVCQPWQTKQSSPNGVWCQ